MQTKKTYYCGEGAPVTYRYCGVVVVAPEDLDAATCLRVDGAVLGKGFRSIVLAAAMRAPAPAPASTPAASSSRVQYCSSTQQTGFQYKSQPDRLTDSKLDSVASAAALYSVLRL